MKWLTFIAPVALVGLASCGVLDGEPRNYQAEVDEILSSAGEAPDPEARAPSASEPFARHLEFAIMRDPDTAAARSSLRAAQSGVPAAESAVKPQASASVLAGGYADNLENIQSESGAALDLKVSQLVYDGGEAAANISLAQLDAALAEVGLEVAANAAAADAASAWIAAWRAQGDISSLSDLEADLRPHVEQVKRMSNSGLIDRSISDMIDSRMIEFEILKRDAQSRLSAAAFLFAEHFGYKPWALPYPGLAFDEAALGLADVGSVEGPATREGALRLLSAREQLKVADAKFGPRVSAEAGGSSPMDRDDKPNGRLGVNVTFQFFDGGKRAADRARAEENVERAEFALWSARQSLSQSLAELAERRQNIRETARLTSEKLTVLGRQLDVANSQIQTGQADVSKVFEMKVQRQQLEASLRAARADLRTAEYQMAAALGVFGVASGGE